MNERNVCKNYVELSGTVASNQIKLSHEFHGKRFYTFDLAICRLNERQDIIPIILEEELLIYSNIKENDYIYLEGEYRSYNKDGHLYLMVYAKEIFVMDKKEYDINQIVLSGYVCKPVIYRTTPLEKEITDLMVAANRSNGRADYIPCITWKKNARFAAYLLIGDKIEVYGRIQSRKYLKRISENQEEEKTAYEVSVYKLDLLG